VPVNAGGLGDGVFESEFFGHVRGAFTDAKSDRAGCLELADGGTLFLDEITNTPLGQQAKLLRALQIGEFMPVGSSRPRKVAVRVIAAANVDVSAEVLSRPFPRRPTLSPQHVEIRLPPLRERFDDIAPLAPIFSSPRRALSPERRHALGRRGARAPRARLARQRTRARHAMERALLLARWGDRGAGTRLRSAPRVIDSIDVRTPVRRKGRDLRARSPTRARRSARSIAWPSSRTLPGQSCSRSARAASSRAVAPFRR